jgi:hypothetical protein
MSSSQSIRENVPSQDSVSNKLPPREQEFLKRFFVGTTLLFSTLALVFWLGEPNFQKSNSARYVASFLAGLFGFAAVETFRREID